MPAEPAPSVKMFGLQRTCTNVVLTGLKAKFFIASRERGREWKHGPMGRAGDDTPVIVCSFREPLASLVSMDRWSFSSDRDGCPHFRKGWSFAEFLANRHYDWPTPLDRWNEINRHYLEWVQAHLQRGIALRSEDMMSPDDARRQYLRIGDHFFLRQRGDHVHVFKRRVNNSQALLQQPMNFDDYTQRRYLAEYPDDVRAGLVRGADPWVLEQLGYTDLTKEG
jgi:hypothetical protein